MFIELNIYREADTDKTAPVLINLDSIGAIRPGFADGHEGRECTVLHDHTGDGASLARETYAEIIAQIDYKKTSNAYM